MAAVGLMAVLAGARDARRKAAQEMVVADKGAERAAMEEALTEARQIPGKTERSEKVAEIINMAMEENQAMEEQYYERFDFQPKIDPISKALGPCFLHSALRSTPSES